MASYVNIGRRGDGRKCGRERQLCGSVGGGAETHKYFQKVGEVGILCFESVT